MPIGAARQHLSESDSQPLRLPESGGGAREVVAWSSFFFALLQSVCTFFAALDGLRLVIGVSSLAVGAAVGATLDTLHGDWIRVPMILLALAGSLLNLIVLWQVRRLRKRPASQWRQQPISARKLRMERLQFFLSVATLALIGIEEYLHLAQRHHL
jgi:hypothetical protein